MLLATDVAARGLDIKEIIVMIFSYNNWMQIRKNILFKIMNFRITYLQSTIFKKIYLYILAY
tara:strand:+ start:48 stop:233 length:186 start_codon:yes stop_codon:yes gene_type:complete